MLWEAILLGILAGWLRKGKIKNLNQIDLTGWPLIMLALFIQGFILADFNFQAYYFKPIYPYLYISSFIILLAFVYLHRNNTGFLVIGAGILLNLVVIASNGGMMPADGTAIPPDVLEELTAGEKSPFHQPMDDQTLFAFLGDRIPLFYRPNQLLSIGDLVLAVGVFILVQQNMRVNRDLKREACGDIQTSNGDGL